MLLQTWRVRACEEPTFSHTSHGWRSEAERARDGADHFAGGATADLGFRAGHAAGSDAETALRGLLAAVPNDSSGTRCGWPRLLGIQRQAPARSWRVQWQSGIEVVFSLTTDMTFIDQCFRGRPSFQEDMEEHGPASNK